jgi:CRISPR-associated protein Cas1
LRRHLNTLFVTRQGSYVHKDGESVVVKQDRDEVFRVPVHNLGGIVCFGNVLCSPFLLGHCMEHKVSVSFLSEHGRYLGRVMGETDGNVLVRREQYRRADQAGASAEIARSIVIAKVANSRGVLLRALRDHQEKVDDGKVRAAVRDLERALKRLAIEKDLDAVRGLEGEAASRYFSVFDELVVSQKEGFRFTKRSRRPPLDSVNALLSFIYTLVLHDVRAAVETVGLDPEVGFLHRDRPGRPSLVLDLMEELRPWLADRLVLSLINRKQIDGRGFSATGSGAVLMDEETRKTVIVAYQKRKQDEILHGFTQERVSIGLIPMVQALLLGKLIRNEIDAYPPFLWK